MNGIFLCKTPYQIMAATRLAGTRYQGETVDIVVFDTIANHRALLEPLRACGVYRHVYEYHSRELDLLQGTARLVRPLVCRPDHFWQQPYDFVCLGNLLEWVENAILRAMRRENPQLQSYLYEDGFSAYSTHCAEDMARLHASGLRGCWYRRAYGEYLRLKGLYVFSPELLDWTPDCPVLPIEKIGPQDGAYRRVVNGIFGYEHMTDCYDAPWIFFEESYYADGVDVGDADVVSALAEEIGKEHIQVKIHPRNQVNRFAQLGFRTNADTVIPWEVIALNIGLEDKILLTIASGSALTALVNMSARPKGVIMLMNCREIEDSQLTPTLPMLRKLAASFPELVFLPESLEEAREHIREILN